MSLRRLGITIILALFCSISCTINSNSTYAKESHKVSLRIQDSTGTPILKTSLFNTNPDSTLKTATLTLLRWEEDTLIGTATLSEKGEFIFKGKEPLAPGEYCIKWNKQPVEFFVSDSNSKVNELFVLQGKKLIHKKGALENRHFTGFQNLVNYEWKSLRDRGAMSKKIDSIGLAIMDMKELDHSLLRLFIEQFKPGYAVLDGVYPEYIYINYLTDYRIKNTSFGKEVINSYFYEFESWDTDEYILKSIRNFIKENNISNEMASLMLYEGFIHYKESDFMGDEKMACAIYDNFFKTKEYTVSAEKMFEMKTFTMLNHTSLIGMPAPELLMQDTLGAVQSLRDIARQRRYTVLYFYTDDCIACKLETPKLVEYLNNYKGKEINLYAVYTQDNKDKWIKYINENLQINNPLVRIINVWDPKIDTGFHLLYNVVSTPQMFLIDKKEKISGRRLNTDALIRLIRLLDSFHNVMDPEPTTTKSEN